MTYIEYEKFIRIYFQKQLFTSFGKIIEIKHQEDLKTPTGRLYNIDLNYKFSVGNIEYLTIIECKNWCNTITRDIVLTLNEKANDLKAHKAILVTTKGFQSGAIQYAKEKGIGLIKFTTTGQEEIYSNFSGTDFQELIHELQCETIFKDEDIIKSHLGLIYPRWSVMDYMHKKYGQKFSNLLFEFERSVDNFNVNRIDYECINIIKTISNNWYKDYYYIEKCGLELELINENDVRILNFLIIALKHLISQ